VWQDKLSLLRAVNADDQAAKLLQIEQLIDALKSII
jgi:hypothetical protein